MKPSAPDSLLDKKKKADQALAWPAPMGSEGEGGTPKPTACRTCRALGRLTAQNLLSAPVVPRRRSGALSRPSEVGFETGHTQGHTNGKPPKLL